MAYCFKRKESVSKAIRRLICERLEHALKCLSDSDRVEAIHCARKDIKKARAVLRLVRTRISKKKFRRLTAMLREAATYLAPTRDAYIKVQALRNLSRHFKRQLAPGALRNIRVYFRNGCAEEIERFGKKNTAVAVKKILRREMKVLRQMKVRGKGWKALRPGVKSTYRKSRRAYRNVARSPSPENFHEWRKRAKDLWYQVRLLHPVWPEQMEAVARELGALGDHLGDDHDLFMLRQELEERGIDKIDRREWEALNGLIAQRQGELRSEALALGARFHAEKPSAFCKRLAEYWRTWRRRKKLLSSSTGVTA